MLSSTLAYAISLAASACPKRDPMTSNIAALQTELDDLSRQLNETRLLLEATRPLRRAQVDREMAAQQQINREAQSLQLYQMMQQANTQMNALAHQLSMQNGPYIGQQLGIGMQNFGQALDEYVRNCTPGRHELLTRG